MSHQIKVKKRAEGQEDRWGAGGYPSMECNRLIAHRSILYLVGQKAERLMLRGGGVTGGGGGGGGGG